MDTEKVTHQQRRPRGTGERPMRGVRVPQPTWAKALRRAHRKDGMTLSAVIAHLAGAYAAGVINLPPAPDETLEAPSRSVRLTDYEWAAVRGRATREKTTASGALSQLITGYATGTIPLPRLTYVKKPE